MIGTFLSLNGLRVVGMALSYLAIVWLSRTGGAAAVGDYLVILNGTIVIGTLASIGLPVLIQRLSARMDAATIGQGTRLAIASRWPWVIAVALTGTVVLMALDADLPLTLVDVARQACAAVLFAGTLIVVENMRVAFGAKCAELHRNVTRPVLIMLFLVAGTGAELAILASLALGFILVVWLVRDMLLRHGRPRADGDMKSENALPDAESYVAEQARDLPIVFALSGLSMIFGAMDVVFFGMQAGAVETGLYGAGSRYGMLVNVALMAGTAQMARNLARVAADPEAAEDLAQVRRLVRLVRISSTFLVLGLILALPLYCWIVDLSQQELWPYFAVVAGSFWLQSMFGPVTMFLMQAHDTRRLIHYHLWGIVAFALVGGGLYLQDILLAVPFGAATGALLIAILSWLRIRRSHTLWI